MQKQKPLVTGAEETSHIREAGVEDQVGQRELRDLRATMLTVGVKETLGTQSQTGPQGCSQGLPWAPG